MAAQDEETPPQPAPLYLSSVPTANGNFGKNVQAEPGPTTLYLLRVDPANPKLAALLPAPGADARLLGAFDKAILQIFNVTSLPKTQDKFLAVQQPAMLENIAGNWKIVRMGKVGFQATPPEQTLPIVAAAPSAKQAPASATTEPGTTPLPPPTPTTVPQAEAATVTQEEAPFAIANTLSRVGELQINWQQKGHEVAPLLEMRAYFDQLKEAGVAVGALKLERNAAGKLSGSFGLSYDPASNKLGQLEATIQGLKQVGHGLQVVEKPEQAAARRQEAGYDEGYEPQRSKHVRAAFGAEQWDGLSAQLAAVPKQALTVPEQMQQAAAEQRVQQLARQQGKTKEQVVKDGKSPFDIDTNGNPASAFLKNFYAHLSGAPRTRQSLEVDYEKTRQDLQARLLRHAGNAPEQAELVEQKPAARPDTPAVSPTPKAAEAAPIAAAPAPTFQVGDVPQKVLDSLGLKMADLERDGHLQKLLHGQKTDLLAMQVAAPEGQEPVRFEGKMVLHREANGTVTLKMELPQEKLVIPNEIGGQPFTPEQRQRLETEGNAGLMRGLKDEQGREYNGYVAIDKTMNRVVVLPENKVTLHDTVAGVNLTPEQSHDLREGKVVALANMASGNGGQKFDGTVQVNAAKACIEVRPAAHELQQRQAPQAEQTVSAPAQTVTPVPVETPQVKTRGPRL